MPASSKRPAPTQDPPLPLKRHRPATNTSTGSYKLYYPRRLGPTATDDRLPLIREQLPTTPFTLLDIGCNIGLNTLHFARLSNCQAAVGMDLDAHLISRARNDLRLATIRHTNPGADAPRSCRVVQGDIPRMEKGDDKQLNDEDTQNKYPYNVTFRTEDFAAETAGRTAREVEKYDVVLCLSVTKWVHLTGGDVALKRLFSRMHSCLRPGGVLILEPQLKRSYKIARKKGVVSMKNRHFGNDLKLRPDLFGQYLLSEEGGGFESMSMLRDVRGKGYSFNRPIMAFYKGGAGGVRGDVVARKGLSCRQRRALKESQNKAFYAARGNDGCDVQICEEEEIKR